MNKIEENFPDLESQLEQILENRELPINEYDLIRILIDQNNNSINTEDIFRDSHVMFQTHFILFHTLYRIQERLLQAGKAMVHISPLHIQIQPITESGSKEVSSHDPLRDYYLDLDNLENTTGKDVDELLNNFWIKFLAQDKRKEALETLDLCDPVDIEKISQQYKRLVMQHHPDRGGDEEKLQAINKAMEILSKC